MMTTNMPLEEAKAIVSREFPKTDLTDYAEIRYLLGRSDVQDDGLTSRLTTALHTVLCSLER